MANTRASPFFCLVAVALLVFADLLCLAFTDTSNPPAVSSNTQYLSRTSDSEISPPLVAEELTHGEAGNTLESENFAAAHIEVGATPIREAISEFKGESPDSSSIGREIRGYVPILSLQPFGLMAPVKKARGLVSAIRLLTDKATALLELTEELSKPQNTILPSSKPGMSIVMYIDCRLGFLSWHICRHMGFTDSKKLEIPDSLKDTLRVDANAASVVQAFKKDVSVVKDADLTEILGFPLLQLSAKTFVACDQAQLLTPLFTVKEFDQGKLLQAYAALHILGMHYVRNLNKLMRDAQEKHNSQIAHKSQDTRAHARARSNTMHDATSPLGELPTTTLELMPQLSTKTSIDQKAVTDWGNAPIPPKSLADLRPPKVNILSAMAATQIGKNPAPEVAPASPSNNPDPTRSFDGSAYVYQGVSGNTNGHAYPGVPVDSHQPMPLGGPVNFNTHTLTNAEHYASTKLAATRMKLQTQASHYGGPSQDTNANMFHNEHAFPGASANGSGSYIPVSYMQSGMPADLNTGPHTSVITDPNINRYTIAPPVSTNYPYQNAPAQTNAPVYPGVPADSPSSFPQTTDWMPNGGKSTGLDSLLSFANLGGAFGNLTNLGGTLGPLSAIGFGNGSTGNATRSSQENTSYAPPASYPLSSLGYHGPEQPQETGQNFLGGLPGLGALGELGRLGGMLKKVGIGGSSEGGAHL